MAYKINIKCTTVHGQYYNVNIGVQEKDWRAFLLGHRYLHIRNCDEWWHICTTERCD